MSEPRAPRRRNLTIVAVLLGLLVLVGGLLGWRKLEQLGAEIVGLRQQVAGLGEELDATEERARQSTAEAERQGERAEHAEQLSRRLAERAEAAETASAQAEERAAAERAEAGRARVLADREAAARLESEARSAAAVRDAESRTAEAILAAEEAQLALERVAREAAELRRRRALELDRLQRVLGRIADTRRTALGVVMNLGDSIEFDFDRDELRPENRELLSRIAGVLLTAEGFGIQIYGHTDDIGSVEYNQELSQRRADTVQRYLVEAGVDPTTISTQGMGKSVPLVPGTDPASRQRNRRVEIAVVEVSGELAYEPVGEGSPLGEADGSPTP